MRIEHAWFAVAVVVGAIGCAGSLEASRPPTVPGSQTTSTMGLGSGGDAAAGVVTTSAQRCQVLDDRRAWWGAVAKGSAVLGGASGIATLPVESRGAELGLMIGGVVVGAVAAFAVGVSESAGESWVRECTPAQRGE